MWNFSVTKHLRWYSELPVKPLLFTQKDILLLPTLSHSFSVSKGLTFLFHFKQSSCIVLPFLKNLASAHWILCQVSLDNTRRSTKESGWNVSQYKPQLFIQDRARYCLLWNTVSEHVDSAEVITNTYIRIYLHLCLCMHPHKVIWTWRPPNTHSWAGSVNLWWGHVMQRWS